jgi:hypothetical protein
VWGVQGLPAHRKHTPELESGLFPIHMVLEAPLVAV